jgi:AcrR family transcriptional regulator
MGSAMIPESTADRLLAATERVVLREGGHAISVRRIAGEADENPALISYHFNGLDGLLSRLLELNVNAICDSRALQQERALQARGKQRRLRALIAAYMEPFWTTAAIWHPAPARTVVREVFPMLGRSLLSGAVARINASVESSAQAMSELLPHLKEDELLARLRLLAGAADTLRVRLQDVGLYPLRTSGNERPEVILQTQLLQMSLGALKAR